MKYATWMLAACWLTVGNLGDLTGNALAEDSVQLNTIQHTRDDSVPERFQFPSGQVQASLSRWRQLPDYRRCQVQFPSPDKTPHPRNNTVHGEYFVPVDENAAEDTRRPAVVVLHILGGDFELSRICCRALASHGVACLFIKMPYYGPRRPPGSHEEMISSDPEKTVTRITQAVRDIRRAVDWLEARPEVDARRIGIAGISLGGIVASLTAAVEPRIGRGCFLLAGGDFATLFLESTELDTEREAWAEHNVTAAQVGEALAPVDPLTYAHRLQGKQILMINGTRDRVIPRRCTEQLWELAGQPPIEWWDCTHFSAAWRIPIALQRLQKFFTQPTHPTFSQPAHACGE